MCTLHILFYHFLETVKANPISGFIVRASSPFTWNFSPMRVSLLFRTTKYTILCRLTAIPRPSDLITADSFVVKLCKILN